MCEVYRRLGEYQDNEKLKMKLITHQFSLFEYNQMRPTRKVKVSRERIEAAKRLFNQGDFEGSAFQLRKFREALERYEARIH